MKKIAYVVQDALGIHARPAGLLIKEAAKFSSSIKITANGKEVDAKRIIGVMSLGVRQGQEITIMIDGADEDAAASALETFLKENL